MKISVKYSAVLAAIFAVLICTDAVSQTQDAPDQQAAERKPAVGMSKEELHKLYPASNEMDYYKRGNAEWLIFDDILTGRPNDKIIFYLENDKVVWWNNEVLPETPEARLAAVEQRQKYCSSMPLVPHTSSDARVADKQNTRRQAIEDRRRIWF